MSQTPEYTAKVGLIPVAIRDTKMAIVPFIKDGNFTYLTIVYKKNTETESARDSVKIVTSQ